MSKKRKHDKIVVVDIESTCWEKDNMPINPVSEIIEIGLCLLDLKTLERSSKQSIMVQAKYSKVSEYCTQLTSLTQGDVDRGWTFEKACDYLKESCASKKRVWASWGDYDRIMFERQCSVYGIEYPFGKTHFNIKTLFSISKGMANLKDGVGLKKEYSLPEALDLCGVQFDGRLHRGDDDAFNIAWVLGELLKDMRK